MEHCWYCGTQVKEHPNKRGVPCPDNRRTKDHLTPQCLGGKRTVVACWKCNHAKYHLTLEEYRIIAAFRAGKLLEYAEFKFWGEQHGSEAWRLERAKEVQTEPSGEGGSPRVEACG
jgi:5-methylcytosine-specific restriction endonuclease McrA